MFSKSTINNGISNIFVFIIFAIFATPASGQFRDESHLAEERELLEKVKGQKGEEKFQTYSRLAYIFQDNERSLHYIDMMEATGREMRSPFHIGGAMSLRAKYYYNNYYPDEFLEHAGAAKRYLSSHDDDRYVDMEILVIRQLLKEGLHETALQAAQKLLELAETKRSVHWMAYAYFGIGIVYGAGKHYDKAVEAFEKCYESTDNPKLKLDAALDLISNTYNNGDYTGSLRYCGLALERLRYYIDDSPENDRESAMRYIRMYIHCCYVLNLTKLGDVETAFEHLREAESDVTPYAGLDNQFYNQAAAAYYEATGEYDEAYRYAGLMAEAFLDEDILNYLEALEVQTRMLAGMGRYAEAYRNMEYIRQRQDSLNSGKLAVQLSEFYTLYELGKLEKEKQRQQNLIILIGAVCMFLAVIVGVYIRYSRSLNRKNLALYRQIQENMHNGKEQLRIFKLTNEGDLSREKKLFLEICRVMENEEVFTDPSFSRQTLARLLNTNDKYLADAIHEGTGSTVAKFISDYRLSYSLRFLACDHDISVEEVAIKSGFGSYSSFLRTFSKKYGMSPSGYRKLSMSKKLKE